MVARPVTQAVSVHRRVPKDQSHTKTASLATVESFAGLILQLLGPLNPRTPTFAVETLEGLIETRHMQPLGSSSSGFMKFTRACGKMPGASLQACKPASLQGLQDEGSALRES
jgi:hypothetical protein